MLILAQLAEMTTISKYAKHTVTVITTTTSRGTETTAEAEVDAYVTTYKAVERDVSGSHLVDKTLLFFKPDETVALKDKIRVDAGDKAISIKDIRRPRFVGQTPNHIEVYLD